LLKNSNQKLNRWLLAEARTSSGSSISTRKLLRASGSQRTQNNEETLTPPRSGKHRPQKAVTTVHRLMLSSLPIYIATSEFSCTACGKPLPWLKTLRALHNRFISPSNA